MVMRMTVVTSNMATNPKEPTDLSFINHKSHMVLLELKSVPVMTKFLH
jgi:hypothetical protein